MPTVNSVVGQVGQFNQKMGQKALDPYGTGAIAGNTLGQASSLGFFNPMGSPAIRAALQRRAMRTARNRQRSGQVLNGLLGLDPYAARQNIVDTSREASGQQADYLNNAESQMMLGNQDWVRSLYGNERANTLAAQEAERQRKYEQSQRGGIGGAIGGIIGTGLGAFAGGFGSAAGGAIGRKPGGG